MSEQIIGHDCDGKPIPAGALVTKHSPAGREFRPDTPEQFRVSEGASAEWDFMLNLGEPEQYHWVKRAESGRWTPDCSVRLVQDKHQPADEDFQADLQQWLAGSKQRSKA